MNAMTSTAPARRYLLELVGGGLHEVVARDVTDQRGHLTFFTGATHDDVPEVAASYRSSAVLWWRLAA